MSDSFHIETFDPGGLPGDVVCRQEILKTADGLLLTSGTLQTNGSNEWPSLSPQGLSLGVASGPIAFEVRQQSATELCGTYSFCLSTPELLETRHKVREAARLQAVSLYVPLETLDELQIRCGTFDAVAAMRASSRAGPAFRSWTPDHAVRLIAHQISNCPHRGALRKLYLQGKAVELLATILEAIEGCSVEAGRSTQVSPADAERLMAARDILVDTLDSPPSLDELAKRIGMSTTRLTAGFRRMFAMSVTGFVQEQRLERALADLIQGRTTIAQAAFKVGYSPAHFSTLFRRKFGFPPSSIVRRH
jgi:AraC family transcriptional regulator, transcriptional activator of the genes for pyochelin and ferripyochelin receptors